MRLLQFFFVTLWVIGYVGNGILFLYVEWIYLRQSWIQIFNPFLQIQVLLTLLSMPLFWLLLAMAILGHCLTIVIEKQINRKNDKNDVELDKILSISLPIETSVQTQVLQSYPRQAEKDNLTNDAFIKRQIEHTVSPSGKNKAESSYTASRVSERLYIKYSNDELERIINLNWSSLDVLKNIHHELGFRSRRKAHKLREWISKRLAQLQSEQYRWPTTGANTGLQSLPSGIFKYEEGLLGRYGYRVGIQGLKQSERLEILDSVFLRPLILMDKGEYLSEWGEPRTARRLQKLADSIAAFTRNAKRRNKMNLSKAIQDWESDLAYLKKTYYNNRFSFRWPCT